MSEEEVRGAIALVWPLFDTDGSGFIEKSEFNNFIVQYKGGEVDETTRDTVFGLIDANNDGKISQDEMVGFILKYEQLSSGGV